MAVEQERGVVIHSPPAWRRTVTRALTDEIGPALVVLAAEQGIDDASTLVDAWTKTQKARGDPRTPAATAGARSLGASLWIDDHDQALAVLRAKLTDDDLVAAGIEAWEAARSLPVEVQA